MDLKWRAGCWHRPPNCVTVRMSAPESPEAPIRFAAADRKQTMIRIACPNCRTAFGLGDNLAGKRIRCKNCGTIFGVPAAAAARPQKAVAAVPVAASPAPPKADPNAITPYGIAPVQETPEEAKDNRIDQMVRTAERQKRRNRAWNKVGPGATLL